MNLKHHDIVWGAADATYDGTASASSDEITYASGLVELKVPPKVRSVAFQTEGGIAYTCDSDYATRAIKWPIDSGVKEALDGNDFSGQKLYLYAENGVTVHIRYIVY